ncbi:MAG: flagellar hook-length control protein FliK [Candidatus Brocadiae bacterium]|nr:flagellar hook-length control protein FliK [Candidatus Brocadiia bacterium]
MGSVVGRHLAGRGGYGAPTGVRAATRQAVDVTRQEVVRAARYVRSGSRSELRVQLHPPELGRMKLEIEMRDGVLEVRIRVENPDVRAAIQNELSDLDRALKEAHVDVSRFEVGDYHPGQDEERRETADGNGPVDASHLGADDLDEPLGERSVGWVRISESGRMDCLV